MRFLTHALRATASAALALIVAAPASAGFVTTPNLDPTAIVNALLGGAGLTVTNVTLQAQSSDGAASIGTYSLTPGPTPYGINSPGIVMSTGDVANYSSGGLQSDFGSLGYFTPATAAQAALLSSVAGPGSYFDVTLLSIDFTLAADADRIFFDVVFGSEEFPFFVNTSFTDGFGLFVNGTNIAEVGGLPVNIDHPDFASIEGTLLNGVLAPGGNPLMTFSSILGFGASGTLTFILGDKGDAGLDTTVFLASLTGGDVTGPPTLGTPAPAGLLVGLAGAGMLTGLRRRLRLA